VAAPTRRDVPGRGRARGGRVGDPELDRDATPMVPTRVRLGGRLLLPGDARDESPRPQLHRDQHVVPPRRSGGFGRVRFRAGTGGGGRQRLRGDRALHPDGGPGRRSPDLRTVRPRHPPGAGDTGDMAVFHPAVLPGGPLEGRRGTPGRTGPGPCHRAVVSPRRYSAPRSATTDPDPSGGRGPHHGRRRRGRRGRRGSRLCHRHPGAAVRQGDGAPRCGDRPSRGRSGSTA